MKNPKSTFQNLFIILVIFLMLLPFITTFNEFLTKIVEKIYLYKLIQVAIIPYETMLVRTIISFFGIETAPGTVAIVKNGVQQGTYIAWNCIGWQSLVILLMSLRAGFTGFTRWSVIEAAVFGIVGTFLINLFRISAILIILYYFDKLPAMLFHNYSSVILTIVWLFFFWWFSYSFVLEEKTT